jgi:DNA-binding MarR family transcriptional regulator
LIFYLKKLGEELAKKRMAEALKRKMGLDEGILPKFEPRIGEASLLMNPSRRRIFEYICNHPCSHLRGISRATHFSVHNVKWHLKKLTEGGLISEGSEGKKKLYWPLKNIVKTEECKILSLLSGEEVRAVYLFIDEHPKSTQKEMSGYLNMYQQMLSRILIFLETSGLINHEKIGREKAYSATVKIKELEDAFESKKDDFTNALVEALEKDGLYPKVQPSDDDVLMVEVSIGGGEQSVLKIFKNPFSAILKI